MAEEIRSQGVAVYSDLREIHRAPDMIHGHHHSQALANLPHFPNASAVFACHGAVALHDDSPIFPRVLRYLAVDERRGMAFEIQDQSVPRLPGRQFKPRG